jgi:myo-inositol 2-dehydrogenase/D-chiro-inositol 1-dehydrogenase
VKQVAVIGAGGMGRFHVETLLALPGVELAAIADPYPHPDLERFDVPVRTDVDACAAEGWDGVVIASPDNTHSALTLLALDAGSRVLCEKPLSHDLDGARAVIDKELAIRERRVQVGFMREVDPAHAALAEQLTNLGELQYLRCTHRNTNAEARPPAMVLVQSLSHDIHTVRWLGGEIVDVDARGIPRPGGLLHVLLVLRLASGATATVEFSDDGPAYSVKVEATTPAGVVSSGGTMEPPPRREGRATETACGAAAEQTERSESAIVGTGAIGRDWFGWFAEAYRIQDRQWVESLSGPRAIGPSAADGLAAQLVAEAALTSISEGRTVEVASFDVPELYRP